MTTPLIALVIPVYNAEEYIDECLDSIAAQTYENLELIIVDDSSTDGSAEIINKRMASFTNAQYIRVQNGNAAKTRRDGIKVAKADLVCFVDADDVVDKNYVKHLFDAMEETGADISMCGIGVFSGRFTAPDKLGPKRLHAIESSAASFAEHYHLSETNSHALQTVPCKLFRKKLFDKIDYDVLVTNIFEDNFIMAQILRQVTKIGAIDSKLYWYRQSQGTTSNRTMYQKVEYKGKQLNSVEFFKNVVMEYCRKNLKGDGVDAAINKLVATEFFDYARMVPDLKVRVEYLEQRMALDEQYYKDEIAKRDVAMSDIINSKSYRVGRAITRPVIKIMNAIKNTRS